MNANSEASYGPKLLGKEKVGVTFDGFLFTYFLFFDGSVFVPFYNGEIRASEWAKTLWIYDDTHLTWTARLKRFESLGDL